MIEKELITALTLGLIGGVIPGPVITAIFTEILQSSFKHSLRIIFIALAVETLVAVLSLLLIGSLGLNESIFRILSFAGAGVLLWISTSLWKTDAIDNGKRAIFSLGKITLMILSNGVLWTYWLTICIPKAMFVKDHIILGDFLFMGLVQSGWLISTLLLAFLFSRFSGILSRPGIIPITFKVFSLIFIYFALDMIYKSVQYFFL